jgi:predicted protein tyrosine phosphatase
VRILCSCSQGSNRSVTMAAIIRYVPEFDVLTVGLEVNTPETVEMLCAWADKILIPEPYLAAFIPKPYKAKVKFYDIGPDRYLRPHNEELYAKIKRLLEKDRIA